MNEKIKKLEEIIKESNNIVFLGGAGVSTESGLKDFRGQGGIYKQKYEYPAETILSHNFFFEHNEKFYDFYFKEMVNLNVKPNYAHYFLADLENKGKLKAIITQNIDGLHQKAGSKKVLELHGSVLDNYCCKCNQYYSLNEYKNFRICPKCKGLIKPDVVLYQEPLKKQTIKESIQFIQNAEVLIVGGTSLNVFPANQLIYYFRGKYLILINQEKTNFDQFFNLVINEKIGEVFKQIKL